MITAHSTQLYIVGKLVLFVAGLFLLNACGAQKIPPKIVKVIADPNVEVGEPKDQPSTIDITIYAETDANKNDFGEAVPIDVWVFQLSDDGKFYQSEFEFITSEPTIPLGSTYEGLKEVQVEPGKTKTILQMEIKKDTTFIGIVGGYTKPEKVNWRATEAIKSKGETYKLLVVMNKRKVITNLDR